ncbi:MAG: anaerobic sulfatase maturase [Promethearchaeota archaeon]
MVVTPFQLLVKPVSGRCNLRCSYCFYRDVPSLFPGKTAGVMSDEILRTFIRKYLALGFKENVFVWQGGEPTLAGLEFFERVVTYQQEFGRNQVVGNALQTNGQVIDEAWGQFLADYKFLVGLSIDGPKPVHDAARGAGSHDKATRALRLLTKLGVPVNILSVIHRGNAGKVVESYQYLRTLPTPFLQFIPALDNDPVTGKPTPHSISPKVYGDALCRLFDEWKARDSGRVSVRTFDFVINTMLGLPGNVCTFMESCAPYLVVEHDGGVYPCDFFVRPKNLLGNVVEDPLEGLFVEREGSFSTRKAPRGTTCSGCAWLPLCHGGCLKDREFARNPHPSRSYLCTAYKRFFRHSFHWFVGKAREVGRRHGLEPAIHEFFDVDGPCPCGSGKPLSKCGGGS